MATLNELVMEYGANAFVLADDGNGCSFGEKGRALDYDEDEMGAEYGMVEMMPLEAAHMSDDGIECNFASDWIIKGEGDNPYRVRLYF